jgi:hypothetical protein
MEAAADVVCRAIPASDKLGSIPVRAWLVEIVVRLQQQQQQQQQRLWVDVRSFV